MNAIRVVSITILVLASALTQEGGAQEPLGRVFNPRPDPLNPGLIAFERMSADEPDVRDIWFIRSWGGEPFPLESLDPDSVTFSLDDLISDGLDDLRRYAGDLDWRPTPGREGEHWFAYVGTSGEGGVSLRFNYIDELGGVGLREPLTLPLSANVWAPRWAPDGARLVAESEGRLLLLEGLDTFLRSGDSDAVTVRLLSEATEPSLFPVWSPDGTHVAYHVQGEGEPAFVEVLRVTPDAVGEPAVVTADRRLASRDETRPSWSPDGRYIAYYVERGGGEEGLDIGVVEVMRDQTGRVFRGQVLSGRSPWLAGDVVPNDRRGPAWTEIAVGGGGPRPAVLFVDRDADRRNPVAIAVVERWTDFAEEEEFTVRLSESLGWGTENHGDPVAVPGEGRIQFTFASQVPGGETVQVRETRAEWLETRAEAQTASASGAVKRALLFPGLGQLRLGKSRKALLLGSVGVASAGVFVSSALDAAANRNVFPCTITDGDCITADDKEAFDKARGRMTWSGILFGAVWAYGIIDASFSSTPGGTPPGPLRSISVRPSGDGTSDVQSVAGRWDVEMRWPVRFFH